MLREKNQEVGLVRICMVLGREDDYKKNLREGKELGGHRTWKVKLANRSYPTVGVIIVIR